MTAPSVLGNLLVALAVLASVLYAAATLGPKSWRARAFGALAAWVSRQPAWLGSRAIAQHLSVHSVRAGGCGGCGDCGSAAPAKANADVRIPVAKIGRRV
jgi:hypothetical protein